MALGRKLTFYDQTFGCQMNFKDSEKLNGILEEIGYVKADSENAGNYQISPDEGSDERINQSNSHDLQA